MIEINKEILRSNLEIHTSFYLSDFNRDSKRWKCRICGEFIHCLRFSKHLKHNHNHNLSAVDYYKNYVHNAKCPVVSCSNFPSLPKLSDMLYSCPEHTSQVKSYFQSENLTKLNNKWWQIPEYREKQIETLTKFGFKSEDVSKRNKENWKNPEYRQHITNAVSKANSSAEGILRNARTIRKAHIENPCRYSGKYENKYLYCVQLNSNIIKIGTTGSKYRLKQLKSLGELKFLYFSSSKMIMLIEDEILSNTEDYFVLLSDYPKKLGGKAEVRDISCIPIVDSILGKHKLERLYE